MAARLTSRLFLLLLAALVVVLVAVPALAAPGEAECLVADSSGKLSEAALQEHCRSLALPPGTVVVVVLSSEEWPEGRERSAAEALVREKLSQAGVTEPARLQRSVGLVLNSERWWAGSFGGGETPFALGAQPTVTEPLLRALPTGRFQEGFEESLSEVSRLLGEQAAAEAAARGEKAANERALFLKLAPAFAGLLAAGVALFLLLDHLFGRVLARRWAEADSLREASSRARRAL